MKRGLGSSTFHGQFASNTPFPELIKPEAEPADGYLVDQAYSGPNFVTESSALAGRTAQGVEVYSDGQTMGITNGPEPQLACRVHRHSCNRGPQDPLRLTVLLLMSA